MTKLEKARAKLGKLKTTFVKYFTLVRDNEELTAALNQARMDLDNCRRQEEKYADLIDRVHDTLWSSAHRSEDVVAMAIRVKAERTAMTVARDQAERDLAIQKLTKHATQAKVLRDAAEAAQDCEIIAEGLPVGRVIALWLRKYADRLEQE